MAIPKPPPDPSRATVLGGEPPPPAVPSAVPAPVNERPVVAVLRSPVPVVAAPGEVTVDLSRHTMVPEAGVSGPPPVPMTLVGLRTLAVGPAKLTDVPPQPPRQLQKVALRGIDKPRLVPDARSEPWIMSSDPLGKPVAVNGRMVAVVIAAQVVSFFAGAEDGTMIAEVDLVVAPVAPGKVAEDWALRYVQDDGELRKALVKALYMAFSRLPLWPGLVVRFAGGPPMTQADADANRYHMWIDEDRSPTRVEIDSRFVDKARDAAEEAYLDGQRRLFTGLTVSWWKRRNPPRYRDYQMGKLLADREDPPELDKKKLETLKTALAEHAGPVVSSLSAVVFGNDLDARAVLERRGRTPVRPTAIARPARPTFLEHEPLPDDAAVPLGDGEG